MENEQGALVYRISSGIQLRPEPNSFLDSVKLMPKCLIRSCVYEKCRRPALLVNGFPETSLELNSRKPSGIKGFEWMNRFLGRPSYLGHRIHLMERVKLFGVDLIGEVIRRLAQLKTLTGDAVNKSVSDPPSDRTTITKACTVELDIFYPIGHVEHLKLGKQRTSLFPVPPTPVYQLVKQGELG